MNIKGFIKYMFDKLSMLKSHEGFKKYFKNTSWLFLEKFLRIFAEIFVMAWVARYLGPEQFGLLSYAISFTVLFGALATLGLDGIVIREIVRYSEKTNFILGSSFILKLAGSFLSIFLLFVTIQFTNNDTFTKYLILVIASSLIFKSFNVIDLFFQSKVLSKYVVFANSVALTVSSLLRILLIFINAPLIYFAYVVVLDSVIMAAGYIYFYIKKGNRLKNWKFDYSTAKLLLKYSWPLMLSSVVATVYMKIDQIMIKEMLNNYAVGQYAAAVRLSEAWYFVPVVITASLFPAIINAKKVSEKLYYERLQKLYDLMAILGFSVAIIIVFISTFIVKLLYGINYLQASNILIIHIWAGISVGLGVANAKWIINENLQIIALVRATTGALINVILNYFFIKSYGIKGAAISTLISYFYVNVFSLFFFKKTRKCFWQQIKALGIIRLLTIKLFNKIR